MHQDWLSQVETDGPFLSLPVLKDIWPDGMNRLSDVDDRLVALRGCHAVWEAAFDRSRSASVEEYSSAVSSWIDVVLDDLAVWGPHRVVSADLSGDLVVRSPGETITVRADGALGGRDGELMCLLRVVPPTESLYAAGLDGWSASEVDRMVALLRKAEVSIGVVTDGRWWAVVWAGDGTTTGAGVVDALTWREEPQLRDAFLTLIEASTLRHRNPERRLPRLFERSVLEAEEITEALGVQVRKSVELLVQSFSEARLSARSKGSVDPLCEDPDEVYQASVTIMMRVVFLLFAEERGMLPTSELYRAAYGISDLLDDLRDRAGTVEEMLDHSSDVWHRLLAVSRALYGGANFDELRMPAYGGSLFDPKRFPWLTAERPGGSLRLRVSDRVMLHVLKSVQVTKIGGQTRRISFRDVDVEQIGYIYEGLLGYTCREVEEGVVLGLVGTDGEEPEIDLDTLVSTYDGSTGKKDFAVRLADWVKQNQPAAKLVSAAKLAKIHDAPVDEPEMSRLLRPIAGDDPSLLSALVDWSNFIRRDLRNLPYVVPRGGLVVSETPSRRNAGAHYTPRSLAEEIVLHALQPLVYNPGPLQTNDKDAWRLQSSSAMLDLRVADIAAGSGAFLVAAARYLADRLVEAWTTEGIIHDDHVDGSLRTRAVREVIAHCLYGADINSMAVEMCKLSLWLVSLDPKKPFSFVDDKIFVGNSLLGLTTLDQLRHLHIAPVTKRSKQLNAFIDAEAVLDEVLRIRRQVAVTVDEDDPQRTRIGKRRLLEQSERVSRKLRLIADGIVATALCLGGKPGTALDGAYTALQGALLSALPADGSSGNTNALDSILDNGLTPTVPTDYWRWAPLHWIIEAPEVIIEHGGFDVIIGNPPFLVAKKISAAMGSNMREYMTNQIARGVKGKADAAAFFALRGDELLRIGSGQMGLILPKVIAEGDTRTVGLEQLATRTHIRRAVRSREWPSSIVSTRIALLWFSRAELQQPLWCDGELVPAISSSLDSQVGLPRKPLPIGTRPAAFKGSVLQGDGFLLSQAEALALLDLDPANAEVVRPYYNGNSVTATIEAVPSDWVIDFRELDESEARQYVEPWKLVDSRVRPERQKKDVDKYPRMVLQWWKHWNSRVEMYRAVNEREYVTVISAVSKHAMPVLVPSNGVLSSALVVFAESDPWLCGLLGSSIHRAWLARWGSTLDTRFRYAPSDVWDTFPVPPGARDLNRQSALLLELRATIGRARGLGVTGVFNLVDDPLCLDEDVQSFRSLLVSLDLRILELYGWKDVEVEHGFFEYRNARRFWFAESTRERVLTLLLDANLGLTTRGGSPIDRANSPS